MQSKQVEWKTLLDSIRYMQKNNIIIIKNKNIFLLSPESNPVKPNSDNMLMTSGLLLEKMTIHLMILASSSAGYLTVLRIDCKISHLQCTEKVNL